MKKPLVCIGCSDSQLSMLLLSSFAKEGYFCALATTPQELIPATSELGASDVLLLDDSLSLSVLSAVTVMALKSAAPPVVLVLSESVREADEVKMLEQGVSDYIYKPLRFSVVLARLEKARRDRQGLRMGQATA